MTKIVQLKTNSHFPVQSDDRCCPVCNSSYVDRVKRRFADRLIALFVPLKRYCCGSCGWVGNVTISNK